MTPQSYNDSHDTAPLYDSESEQEEEELSHDWASGDDFESQLGVFGKPLALGGLMGQESFGDPSDGFGNSGGVFDFGAQVHFPPTLVLFRAIEFLCFSPIYCWVFFSPKLYRFQVKDEDSSDSTEVRPNESSIFGSNEEDLGTVHITATSLPQGNLCFSPSAFMESPDLSSMVAPTEKLMALSGDNAIQLTPSAILESPKLEAMAAPQSNAAAPARPLSPMTMFPPTIQTSTEPIPDPHVHGFPPPPTFDNVFGQ